MMNTSTFLAAGISALLLVGAQFALADTTDGGGTTVQPTSLRVMERLQTLERIDVTSEKPVDPAAEALDPALVELLQELAQFDVDVEAARSN